MLIYVIIEIFITVLVNCQKKGGGELRFPYLVTCRFDIYFLVKVCAITTDENTYDLY